MDSELLWVNAVEAFLGDAGCELSREEAVALVYGRSFSDIHADVVRRFPSFDLAAREMEEGMRPYFLRLRDKCDIAIGSSVDLLRTLAADYPVCIVSGSTRADLVAGIRHLGVGACLEFYLAAEDYFFGKPDPGCFLMAAEKLKVPPAECLVFEDSAVGVRGAKRAGMACVALRRPGTPAQDLSAADEVVDDLAKFRPAAWVSA